MFNRLRLVKRPLTSSLPCLCVCILIRGQTYTNQQSSELSAKCRTVASLGCSHDPIHDINLHLLPIIWRIILTCISIHFSSDLLNTGLSFFYCPDGGRHRRGLYLCRYEHYAADKVYLCVWWLHFITACQMFGQCFLYFYLFWFDFECRFPGCFFVSIYHTFLVYVVFLQTNNYN